MLTFLMIGAHPDDMDLRCGGLAMLLRAQGHHVVFLSATNGNAGHMSMTKEALRLRRLKEMEAAAKVYGIVYETLDIDDGYLECSIPVRDRLIRYIRKLKPDVIITHRGCDYHPDHRACGNLVRDCSYLLGVPMICPDVPALRKAPVILSCEDRFTSPAPFRADVGADIGSVIDRKIQGVLAHRSQFMEWLPYDGQWTDVLEASSEEEAAEKLRARLRVRFSAPVRRFPDLFPKGAVYGEVFQTDEYGGKMTEEILQAVRGQ